MSLPVAGIPHPCCWHQRWRAQLAVSAPSIPDSRCASTEQKKTQSPGGSLTVTVVLLLVMVLVVATIPMPLVIVTLCGTAEAFANRISTLPASTAARSLS